jgi:hypothetical protein
MPPGPPALGGLEEKLFETRRAIVRASTSRPNPHGEAPFGVGPPLGCDEVTCRMRLAIALRGGVDERRDRERPTPRQKSLIPNRVLSPSQMGRGSVIRSRISPTRR